MTDPRRSTLPPPLATWLQGINTLSAQASAAGVLPTPALARQALAGITRQFGGTGPELAQVTDITLPECPEIPLRLYDPAPGRPRPVLVYLHGGGHMAGSIAVYDSIVRRVAHHTGFRTVAVEYRLAPEFPYPQGLNDCLTVVRALPAWLQQRGLWPRTGLVLAGDSGGGALTASVTARSIGHPGLPVRGQILLYPSLDYTLSQASVHTNGQGYLLDSGRIRWYFDNYFQAGEDRHAASPLFMPATGLPPTLILTAGFCPLRDEGYAYADHLRAAGVACQHHNLPDMVHAYLNLHELAPQACAQTYDLMAAWVKTL